MVDRGLLEAGGRGGDRLCVCVCVCVCVCCACMYVCTCALCVTMCVTCACVLGRGRRWCAGGSGAAPGGRGDAAVQPRGRPRRRVRHSLQPTHRSTGPQAGAGGQAAAGVRVGVRERARVRVRVYGVWEVAARSPEALRISQSTRPRVIGDWWGLGVRVGAARVRGWRRGVGLCVAAGAPAIDATARDRRSPHWTRPCQNCRSSVPAALKQSPLSHTHTQTRTHTHTHTHTHTPYTAVTLRRIHCLFAMFSLCSSNTHTPDSHALTRLHTPPAAAMRRTWRSSTTPPAA